MLWLRQAVARQRGSGLSQRPEGGYGDQLPQHGKSYPVKTGAGREASPEQATGPPEPLTPARGSRQSGTPSHPSCQWGCHGPRPPVPRAAVGEGLSAAALSTVWGSGSCLGDWRREAAGVSRWLRQSPRAGLDPSSPASMRRAGWWSQRVLGSDSVTVAHSLSPRPNAGHQGQWEECGGRMWGLCTGHCGRISTRFTAL